nr:MAG TPA: hypothetical protein [Caudoviricetes sp.]
MYSDAKQERNLSTKRFCETSRNQSWERIIKTHHPACFQKRSKKLRRRH